MTDSRDHENQFGSNRERQGQFPPSSGGGSEDSNFPTREELIESLDSDDLQGLGGEDLSQVYGSASSSKDSDAIHEPASFGEIEEIVAGQNQAAANVGEFHLEKGFIDSELKSRTAEKPLANSLNENGESSTEAVSEINQVATNVSSDTTSIKKTSTGTTEIIKSLLWLATMIVFFLSIISLGPSLVQRYQYAWTKGSLEAKYDLATKMLPTVADSGHSIVNELVVHKISPSVVSIVATSKVDRFRASSGQGSGVVISNDGLIVTNNHVVENAKKIRVTLADRRVFDAEIIGTDPHTDLAVIQVDADDLTPAQWGDSSSLELGSQVWALGSPFGLKQTVTKGILSGKHRAVSDNNGPENQFQDLLQTDAAINPGNSGGPLVNSRGEIIGINVSIYGKVFQGISFAVPSSLAKEIVEKLIRYGKVERGFLGIRIEDVTHRDQIHLGLPKISGARVTSVTRGSAAAVAGIQRDDVITKIGQQDIENTIMLFRHIGLQAPGSEVPVELYRDGKKFVFRAVMARRSLVENW